MPELPQRELRPPQRGTSDLETRASASPDGAVPTRELQTPAKCSLGPPSAKRAFQPVRATAPSARSVHVPVRAGRTQTFALRVYRHAHRHAYGPCIRRVARTVGKHLAEGGPQRVLAGQCTHVRCAIGMSHTLTCHWDGRRTFLNRTYLAKPSGGHQPSLRSTPARLLCHRRHCAVTVH